MQPSNTATFVANSMECVVTTLHFGSAKLQVAVVYRSPSVPKPMFIYFMTNLISHVSTAGIATLVLGDVNDDILCDAGYGITWVHTAGKHSTADI